MVFIVGAGWVVGGMGMRSGMVVGVGSGWDSSLDGGRVRGMFPRDGGGLGGGGLRCGGGGWGEGVDDGGGSVGAVGDDGFGGHSGEGSFDAVAFGAGVGDEEAVVLECGVEGALFEDAVGEVGGDGFRVSAALYGASGSDLRSTASREAASWARGSWVFGRGGRRRFRVFV